MPSSDAWCVSLVSPYHLSFASASAQNWKESGLKKRLLQVRQRESEAGDSEVSYFTIVTSDSVSFSHSPKLQSKVKISYYLVRETAFAREGSRQHNDIATQPYAGRLRCLIGSPWWGLLYACFSELVASFCVDLSIEDILKAGV